MNRVSNQNRGGLQVVKVSQDPARHYDLDEEALASVLLRPDIRNLPVVVVSVAGAYRGGKSFILDFFLRYLMAPREQQLNGQWLGKDDDLLEGFNWRGGAECDTKGIYVWPEPIVVNIERTGGKVAVLLMDTQGTFDTESDMGDNSTIFALSVLLSSTQIYNLRSNIREDDLQHLRLFTEYGKLACKLDGKAFQTLLFLIRDWTNAYEHDYGYAGGKELMDKKLLSKPNQEKQLFEVRKHIRSYFEKLECFLMPHPGLGIASREFKGRLCDIDKQFRLSLLDLVPTLFDLNNLIPKTINGEQVQAQGLFEYFKQYAAIFNTNEMPAATTIFQATADASITSALREACQYYESMMKTKIIEDQTVLMSMLQTWHSKALDTAIAHFENKKMFGSKKKIAESLADLKKTTGSLLLLYQLQNDTKLRKAQSEAQKTYEDIVGSVCKEQAFICLHPRDLEALHNKALTAALNSFDPTRTKVPQELDTDRNDFIKNLQQNYQRFCTISYRNNSSALLEARMLYLTLMKDKVKQDHEHSLKTAVEHFLSQRNQPTEETEDQVLDQLRQEVEEYFEEFKKAKAQKNLYAMNAAECAYNNYMNSITMCAMGSYCHHPRALRELHDEALSRSLEQFQNYKQTDEDNYENRLIANIEQRYEDVKKLNDHNNINAVDLAYNEYKRIMDAHMEPSFWDILIIPRLLRNLTTSDEHKRAENQALSVFYEKRRGSSYPDNDPHLDNLKSKIDKAHTSDHGSYLSVVEDVVNEVAEHVINPLIIYGVKKITTKVASALNKNNNRP